jgi:nucleoside-diphosphate-sugar epimerase
MRVFVAGATGVIGVRLVPLLMAAGHTVAGMTRTPAKVEPLRAAGATAVLCDVFDRAALVVAVEAFAPDLVMHQVTDLPDDVRQIEAFLPANRRVRSEGTQNLLAAAAASGARVLAQSVAWPIPGIAEHDDAVLAAGGTVLRYGRFRGPGTYSEHAVPPAPSIHVDAAAARTMDFLTGPPGTFTLVEDR